MITRVLINGGESDGRIPVTDSSVLRGDGCFEVLRSYRGRSFALEPHLDRLERSASLLGIALPERSVLVSWVDQASAEIGDGAVRVVVTRGSSVAGLEGPPAVIVFAHSSEIDRGPVRLLSVEAPWHAAGADWELAGAKVLSYAPNMAAARRAREMGYDDAMLISTKGSILEGPTFSVAWVVDGSVETPALSLGILDSITRRVLIDAAREAGVEVGEGDWGVERLENASEVMAWSTLREVQPVLMVDDLSFTEGRVTAELAAMFSSLVAADVDAQLPATETVEP